MPRKSKSCSPKNDSSWVGDLRKKLESYTGMTPPTSGDIPTVQSERQKRRESQEPTGTSGAMYE